MRNTNQSYIILVINTAERVGLNLVYNNFNVCTKTLLGSLRMYSLLSDLNVYIKQNKTKEKTDGICCYRFIFSGLKHLYRNL